MNITNATPFQVATMLGDGPGGGSAISIIIKGTFAIRPGEPAIPALDQLPILTADEFYDDDDIESVRFESDMVPYKPRADIVLVGRAYAPQKTPVTVLDVSLQLGRLLKRIRVYGDRSWFFPSRLALVPTISEPLPFTVMDLVYDRAYGGIDSKGGKWCKENLIGKGFIAKKTRDSIHEIQLPNLEEAEEPETPIESWKSRPMPVGFGFYGREWLPRAAFLGTIDEAWIAQRAPRMPEDFSFEFFNGAHPDLQLKDYLRGDEQIELINLSPSGLLRFFLPGLGPIVTIATFKDPPRYLLEPSLQPANDDELEPPAPAISSLDQLPILESMVRVNLDTVCIIPDENRFYLVWRAVYPLKDLETMAVELAGIKIEMCGREARPTQIRQEAHRRASVEAAAIDNGVIELGLLESTQPVLLQSAISSPISSPASVPEELPMAAFETPEESEADGNNEANRVIELGLLESTQSVPNEIIAQALRGKAAAADQQEINKLPSEAQPTGVYLASDERKAPAADSLEPLDQPSELSEQLVDTTPFESTQSTPVLQKPTNLDTPLGSTSPAATVAAGRQGGDSIDRQVNALAAAYRKRLDILAAPLVTWETLAEQEQGFFALVEALKATKKTGIRKLIAVLDDPIPERVFAAAISLLKISAEQFFITLVAHAAGATEATIRSFVDAVRLANVSAIERYLTPQLGSSDPSIQLLLLSVIGDRRLKHPAVMEFVGKCLFSVNKEVTIAALKAQGKLRFPDFLPLIRRLALNPDSDIQDLALLDLLLDGKPEAFRVLRRLCNMGTKSGSWRYIHLAFNGVKADVPLLAKHTHEPLAWIGLGILGFAEPVPILIKLLTSNFPQVRQAAAAALQLITGATIEDNLTSRHEQNFERCSLSAPQWLAWWEANGAKFSPGVRWRRGKTFNPGRCIRQLADCSLSVMERTWAYQELVILTGQDYPFEADWLVNEQKSAIEAWEAWWRHRGKTSQE